MDLERVSLTIARESLHSMVMNDFHSLTCKIDFPELSLEPQTVARDDDGGGDASSDCDACETGDTLVECFEYLTFSLEPLVELSLKCLTFSAGCSTVAVERKAMRWDCCCRNSTMNSSTCWRLLSSLTSLNATNRSDGVTSYWASCCYSTPQSYCCC